MTPTAKPISADCSKRYHAVRSSGTRKPSEVKWIVLHDEEAPTAEAAAAWFANPDSQGSAHLCVDENECFRTLEPNDVPWGAASAIGANTHGFHIEQAGYAAWSAVVWGSHLNTLKRAAYKTHYWAKHFGIPLVWVDAEGLKQGRPGITTHREVSKASRDLDRANAWRYTHSDPGPFWPRRRFMALVRSHEKKP